MWFIPLLYDRGSRLLKNVIPKHCYDKRLNRMTCTSFYYRKVIEGIEPKNCKKRNWLYISKIEYGNIKRSILHNSLDNKKISQNRDFFFSLC